MRQLISFSISGVVTLGLIGCGGFRAARGSGSTEKQELLAKKPVFLAQSLEYCDVEGAGTQVATTTEGGTELCYSADDNSGSVPSPGNPGNPANPGNPNPPGQTVKTVCSDELVGTNGGSVMSGNDVKLQVTKDNGSVVCEVKDPKIKTDLINEKKLKIFSVEFGAQCPFVEPGEYNLLLKNGNSKNLMSDAVKDYALYKDHPRLSPAKGFMSLWEGHAIPVGVKAAEYTTGVNFVSPNPEITVLLDTNPGGPHYEGPIGNCDYAASPLLVQFSSNSLPPKKLSLSAPLSGTKFNILGAKSYPSANSKKQISWLKGHSAEGNYFIVLPYRGQVLGIDQMFGDNTLGPDGKFAANGYEALRKYDVSGDGLITSRDPVFGQLRLWSDSNGNGSAEPAELLGFYDKGIVSIDLNYDPSYREVDRYGNEIKMKSVVQTLDNKLHVMYDVWFRIID
jgi:hypothetical protein